MKALVQSILEGILRLIALLKRGDSLTAPTKPLSTPAEPVRPQDISPVSPNPVPVPEKQPSWKAPVPPDYFMLSQGYLNEDWALYPKFGHHTGVDYGGHGKQGIPLFACGDGEIVYRDVSSSTWGGQLGNHLALYVPSVDKSFLYCHLASDPPELGAVKAGDEIGVMGNTGKSASGATHLHLEGFHGRFKIAWRSFTSFDDIKQKTFDANQFIQSQLSA